MSAIKFIDVAKVEKIAKKVIGKKINLNRKADIIDMIDGEKTTTMERNRLEQTQVPIKKHIVPDAHIEKMGEKQTLKKEKLKNVTNAFLKLKMVEDIYLERLKNKQIDYSRRSRYGDFVYYSTKTSFRDKNYERYANSSGSPENHFYLKLKKGDFISDKLAGKKVGQVVKYGYDDLLASLPENDRKAIVENIKATMNKVNRYYENKDVKLPETKDLLYAVAILDFVPNKVVKDLLLETDSLQQLPREKQETDGIKNIKSKDPVKNKPKNNVTKDMQPKGEKLEKVTNTGAKNVGAGSKQSKSMGKEEQTGKKYVP
jgi:hypothetical protein